MNKREKSLLKVFRDMNREGQSHLQDYADFLHQRYRLTPSEPEAPAGIPRPENESVVAAIKRLSATYPMLNKDSMLHETSALMAQHLLQGRAAAEVIDELQALFLRQYESLVAKSREDRGDA